MKKMITIQINQQRHDDGIFLYDRFGSDDDLIRSQKPLLAVIKNDAPNSIQDSISVSRDEAFLHVLASELNDWLEVSHIHCSRRSSARY